MAANDNVTVRIVGDASGVQPAVQEADASLAGLKGMLGELNASMKALTAQMSTGFVKAAGDAHKMAAGIEEAKIAAGHASTGIGGMVARIHEGAESVRTFQMRAKEFAEVYVAMFAVERIGEWINKMGEAAEKVEHLSQQFGMATGEVQQLKGVATATGISFDALTKGMGFLDKNLASAASGSKILKGAMDQVGLSFNDGRSQMEKLAVVADKFKNMDDGPKKVALAMQLFGRSGRELIPVLNLGSAGIQALNAKMAEYGVVNEDAVQKGVALAESVNESKLAFAGIGNVLTSALAPTFKIIVDDLNSLVAAFVKSYREGGIVAEIFAAISVIIQETVAVIEALAEIFGALWDTVSEVVSEIASAIFECFGAKAPSYINYSKLALNEFKDLLTIVKDAVVISLEIIGGAFRVAMQIVVAFGKIAWDALSLNWGAIQGDWQAGMAKIDQIVSQEAGRIKAHAAEMAAAIQAAARGEALGGKEGSGLKMPKAGGDFDYTPAKTGGGGGKKKEGMSLAEKLEAELEAKKTAWAMEQDAQGTFQQYSLQSEADFWAAALRRQDLSAKDRLAIEKKFLAARQALKKDEIQTQLEGYADELEAAGANWDKKLEILRQEQAYIRRMYGDESREARQANEAVVRAEREKAAQLRELSAQISKGKEDAALAGVDSEEAAAQFEVDMGRRTAGQLLAQDKQFENERFQIRRQALLESLRLAELDPNTGPAKLRQIYAQIEALERQHQAQLSQIDRQATLQRTQMARDAFQQIGQSFGSHISKMITLQENWRQGLIGIYQDLVGVVANVVAQIIEKWVAAFLTKLILGKQEAAQSAANYVGQAGAGGVASMAAAPFPINLTAPAFGASMAAAAAAFGAVASAEGGDWRVKGGMYRLHDEEMVLPAWAAGGLRSMLGGSRAGGDPAKTAGRGGDVHLHYSPNVQHADQSLKDSLKRDGRDMRRWIERKQRNGAFSFGQLPSAA